MNKFRFKVWRNDYTVTMKIFEQPEETRGKCFLFKHNGVEIYSVDCPQIDGDCIFIRGAILAKDNRAATISFDSLDEAEAYRKKITEALKAYAKHLEEQETPKPTPKCAEKLVYQFDRIGCVVVATPIHIPEWVKNHWVFKSSGGFALRGQSFNQLSEYNLYISVPGTSYTKVQGFYNFYDEDKARKMITNATKAIAECNAKYATVAEPKARFVSRETVIAE